MHRRLSILLLLLHLQLLLLLLLLLLSRSAFWKLRGTAASCSCRGQQR
jgi:hypothetical protein